ncbi:MAG: endonuclease, partial [Chitinophagales bacterium]|nr:endonuclease [Chitinophagales bacterium]
MKHTLLIFATLFAFAGCTDENNSLPKEGTLSLLTYNVAGLPEGFSSSS